MSASPDTAWLAQLHDVIIPPAISWWPLAPGWWLVITLLALIVLHRGQIVWQRWQRNAYRRVALRALTKLPAGEPAEQVATCLALLRRACCTILPPSDVADAQGPRWIAMLSERCPRAIMDQRLYDVLTTGAYCRPERIAPDDASRMITFTRCWLQEHQG